MNPNDEDLKKKQRKDEEDEILDEFDFINDEDEEFEIVEDEDDE